MAFILANLAPVGGQSTKGRAPQKFTYATLDTHATVDTTGYFNAAAAILAPGDIIEVVVFTTTLFTGAVSTYGPHIVLSNDGTVVDVSNVTVGVVTDTD